MAPPSGAARRGHRSPAGAQSSDRRAKKRPNPDRTTAGGRDRSSQPRLGERIEFPCLVCGDGSADATYRLTSDGYPDWLIGCFSASCRDLGGAYLGDLGDALGAGRDASKAEIVNALRALPSAQTAANGRNGRREPLPTDSHLAGWRARLWADSGALAYLRGRGLADETIRRAGIGYGEFHGRPPAFMLPVRNRRGGLLTLKERYWPELWTDPTERQHKSRTLAGRGSHLYPALGDERSVILAAGEFDVLVTAQEFEGVAVVTPTTGTAIRDGLLEDFSGRRVALIYDVGEEDAAGRNAARLREAGADAFGVGLPLPRRGDDLTDWLVTYERTADDLRDLIRRARRSHG